MLDPYRGARSRYDEVSDTLGSSLLVLKISEISYELTSALIYRIEVIWLTVNDNCGVVEQYRRNAGRVFFEIVVVTCHQCYCTYINDGVAKTRL